MKTEKDIANDLLKSMDGNKEHAIICCNEIIAQYINKNCETARCYKQVKKILKESDETK